MITFCPTVNYEELFLLGAALGIIIGISFSIIVVYLFTLEAQDHADSPRN